MRGVFCLEGMWFGDHRDTTSVNPILELIERDSKMPYLYHRCGTIEELKYSLERWKTKGFHKKYPILYLAFHGQEEAILVGKKKFTLSELADVLETKCEGVIIYFGSCETMLADKRRLDKFLERTKALAILGYKKEVDWLHSASFEIQLLDILNRYPFDNIGIKKIQETINKDCKHYVKALDFRILINEYYSFPRRRKPKA